MTCKHCGELEVDSRVSTVSGKLLYRLARATADTGRMLFVMADGTDFSQARNGAHSQKTIVISGRSRAVRFNMHKLYLHDASPDPAFFYIEVMSSQDKARTS